jgi:hypothetical protein
MASHASPIPASFSIPFLLSLSFFFYIARLLASKSFCQKTDEMSLVIDDRTRAHWEKAQTKPEWGATKFWEYVLKEQFFTSRDWSLSSQQPPTDKSSNFRRMELGARLCQEEPPQLNLALLSRPSSCAAWSTRKESTAGPVLPLSSIPGMLA